MADNVAITQGVGTSIASDEIDGVQYPRVKMNWGADGATNDTSAANPLPTVQTGALPAGTNSIGGTKDDGPGATAGTLQTPVHGDCSTATALTAAPTGGQKWVVTDIFISTAAACEVDIEEETSATVLFGPLLLPANFAGQFTPRGKLKLPTADRKVMVKSSTADHITAQISGYSEA